MKNLIFICCCLTSFCCHAATFVADSTALPGVLLLHGTPVSFRLQNAIYPGELQEGQLIPVVVSQEVAVIKDGQKRVAINREQTGQAIVERVQRRNIFGQPGAVTLKVVSVTTFDDTVIPMDGESFTVRGRGRKGVAWGISIAIPVIGVAIGAPYLLPFGAVGIFIKGKNNPKMGTMTRLNGVVREDVRVYKAK